jgi:hypothetical protein
VAGALAGRSWESVGGRLEMSQLLTLDRLEFNQEAEPVELTNEYLIRDEEGRDVGVIRER